MGVAAVCQFCICLFWRLSVVSVAARRRLLQRALLSNARIPPSLDHLIHFAPIRPNPKQVAAHLTPIVSHASTQPPNHRCDRDNPMLLRTLLGGPAAAAPRLLLRRRVAGGVTAAAIEQQQQQQQGPAVIAAASRVAAGSRSAALPVVVQARHFSKKGAWSKVLNVSKVLKGVRPKKYPLCFGLWGAGYAICTYAHVSTDAR